MAVVDFTGVISNIQIVTGDNTSTFTVTVKDKLSRSTEALALELSVEEVMLELSQKDYFSPGDNLDINLAFNGGAVADNVSFEYYHTSSAMWRPLSVAAVSEPRGRAMSDFTVTLSGTPDVDEDLQIRAKCAGKISATLKVGMAPFEVAGNDNDTYATRAYVTVIGTDGAPDPSLAGAEFYVKAEGESEYRKVASSLSGKYALIEGLTPNVKNYVKVAVDGLRSKATVLNTEEILTLPNSGMEEWCVGTRQGNGWWQVDYPSLNTDNQGPWGTMNLLTTSEGNAASLGGAPACGYSAKSGTWPTDDAVSGKAAAIQSVGWGKGNTALSFAGWKGKCEHTTAGELYLGVYNASTKLPDYGYAFASRPSSISFYAKYQPKNSADYGTAEIRMVDAAGKTIASKTVNINNTAYEAKTLALDYAPGYAKASSIVVIFKSSGNPDCLPFSTANYNTPPSANASTSKGYEGSILFVDEITLNY